MVCPLVRRDKGRVIYFQVGTKAVEGGGGGGGGSGTFSFGSPKFLRLPCLDR